MGSKNHVRSSSFPARSHPSTLAVLEELNKLRAGDFSAASTSGSMMICAGLSGLEELHRCTEELLNMPSTQKMLGQGQNSQQFLDELLERSVRLIDICSVARDLAARVHDHTRALQSALRRRKGDSSMESRIASYQCFRKNMHKEAKTLLSELKKMGNDAQNVDQGHHPAAVFDALEEVNQMNISIFRSLLMFLAVPVRLKRSKWSLVSKLVHKGTVGCEGKEETSNENELQALDAELRRCTDSNDKAEPEEKQALNKRLKALETNVKVLEDCLECMFRRSIKTRASLLNIVSQ